MKNNLISLIIGYILADAATPKMVHITYILTIITALVVGMVLGHNFSINPIP